MKEYEVYETYKKEEPVFYFLYEDNLFQLIFLNPLGFILLSILLVSLDLSEIFLSVWEKKRKEKKKRKREREKEDTKRKRRKKDIRTLWQSQLAVRRLSQGSALLCN